MKKKSVIFAAMLLISVFGSVVDAESVRPPVVAGKFYPSDPGRLSAAIRYYLEAARPSWGQRPVALIAPHAGYIYSGQICADAFNQAAGQEYDLAVLLGTNHTASGFAKVSVYAEGGFETPLGVAEIDSQAAGRIIQASEDASFVKYPHDREHSVEVLVPFVQSVFPGAKIVPVVVGEPDVEMCVGFGKALGKVLNSLEGRRPIVIASSDLSHYPSYGDAVKVDSLVLDAVTSMSPEKLERTVRERMGKKIPNLSTCACGLAPIMAAMAAAGEMGARCAKIVSYANSGDAAVGDRDRVVGYGAVAFFDEDGCERVSPEKNRSKDGNREDGELDREDREKLLRLARQAVEQYLASETLPLPRNMGPALETPCGAFVTLKKHGRLRGCIGRMAGDLPLCQTVAAMAVQAAFNDRRFTPVTMEEFSELEIEISVLTPFERVPSHESIVVGRDGVVLEKDGKRAVFLPQVPVEQGWTRDRMLEQLCVKAGLAKDGWRDGAVFHTFQARVFSEHDLK